MDGQSFATMVAKVEERLESFLPSGDEYDKEILEAMRYSLLAGGKRLRPVLVLACCEAVGESAGEAALNVACALECVHTYSLIHDDLPGMDNDELRRGKPTNHMVFGEAMAILAGDGLLTEAFSAISTALGETSLAASLMRELSLGAGYRGMVGGQAQDILCENKRINAEQMKWIHRHKTGALIVTACRMGGMLGGANKSELKSLTEFGSALGLLFQITDDILDVVGDEALLGKHTGADERQMKATYPALYGLERSRELAVEAAGTAKESLNDLSGDVDFLCWLVDYVVDRQR